MLYELSLLAQASNPGWAELLIKLDPGKLVMLGIFGSIFVSALAYGIASIIRAAHGSPDDSEELSQKIAELESRVRLLEQKSHETATY